MGCLRISGRVRFTAGRCRCCWTSRYRSRSRPRQNTSKMSGDGLTGSCLDRFKSLLASAEGSGAVPLDVSELYGSELKACFRRQTPHRRTMREIMPKGTKIGTKDRALKRARRKPQNFWLPPASRSALREPFPGPVPVGGWASRAADNLHSA